MKSGGTVGVEGKTGAAPGQLAPFTVAPPRHNLSRSHLVLEQGTNDAAGSRHFHSHNAMQRTLEARLNPRSIHILDTKAKSTPRGAETQRQRQAQRRRIATSQPLPPRALAPENINPFALKSKQKHSQFVYPCAYFPVSYSTERSISWSAIPPLPASSFRVVVITFSLGETGERGRVRKRRQTLQVGRPRAGQQAVEKET